MRRDDKTVVIIEGMSLYATSRNLGFDIDYAKMLDYFRKDEAEYGNVCQAYYFVVQQPAGSLEHSPVKPLCDWLNYNGFKVPPIIGTESTNQYTGKNQLKGKSISTELGCHMVDMAAEFADQFILFSGNGELCTPVSLVQRRGSRVTLVSSIRSQFACHDELRRQADRFIELDEIKGNFTRAFVPRQQKQAAA